MKQGERGLWLVLVVILAGMNFYQYSSDRYNAVESRTESAETPDVPELSVAAGELPGLSDYQRRRFEQRGLSNPQREILQDLLERPELIPQDPVLGGTMFFVPDTTYLLSDRWVMATYEDGHVQGRALFRYQVSPEGEITWQLIDSYKD